MSLFLYTSYPLSDFITSKNQIMEEFVISILAEIVRFFVVIAFFWVVISYAIRARQDIGHVTSRWHTTLDNMHFSPNKFYQAVQEKVKAKNVHVSISVITLKESRGSSFLRDYLRIADGDQMFLICAAPYGKDFFVSWWFGETMSFRRDLIPRIPVIGIPLAKLLYSKTYFQMDTDDMFKDTVRKCVLSVIDEMANEKGIRGLTDLERMPQDAPLKPAW